MFGVGPGVRQEGQPEELGLYSEGGERHGRLRARQAWSDSDFNWEC